MKHIKKIADIHRLNGLPAPEHPLFSVVRCNVDCGHEDREFITDFYIIGLKKLRSGVVRYGRTKYDHDTGSMSFLKPRQMVQFKDLEFEEDGFLIFIHQDYISGHNLYKEIGNYAYFDYETNEALHLSPREEQIMWDLFDKIQAEYKNNPDEFSKDIILTHVDSMLKYSKRFYKRQFIDRSELSGNIVTRLEKKLDGYFQKGILESQGLPTVSALAEELGLSPKYFSDLLKQETGKTAIELIHIYIITEAKNRLTGEACSISEVAYSLGFENLPYFSRLFKKETGLSPIQFRRNLLN